jgi:hypothetical protein
MAFACVRTRVTITTQDTTQDPRSKIPDVYGVLERPPKLTVSRSHYFPKPEPGTRISYILPREQIPKHLSLYSPHLDQYTHSLPQNFPVG